MPDSWSSACWAYAVVDTQRFCIFFFSPVSLLFLSSYARRDYRPGGSHAYVVSLLDVF